MIEFSRMINRRYLYILSTLSVVGSVDHLISILEFYGTQNPFLEGLGTTTVRSLEDHQKFNVIGSMVILALHAMSFLSLLIMSYFDVQIFLKDGYSVDNWATLAINDVKFT
jgi:hypothetical protein